MTHERTVSLPLRSLVVPAVVTLAVTLLRLTGELRGWSTRLFGDSGGGGALVGIVWLVPLFGAYFGYRLAAQGATARAGAVIARALFAAVLVVACGAFTGLVLRLGQISQAGVLMLALCVGAWVAYRGFPALGRTLLLYGLAARLPVMVVMLVAILVRWQTHYNAPPPALQNMGPLAKWVLIAVLPQTFMWIPFTIIVGAFFGGLALLGARLRPRDAI
jgi:hypothetical protein